MDDRAVGRPTRIEGLSQRRRRLVVAAMHLGLAAYAVVGAFGGDSPWVLLSVGFLLGAIIIHFRFLLPLAREANSKVPRGFDERQISIRDRAYHRAYRILGNLFLLAVACVVLYARYDTARFLPLPETSVQFEPLLLVSLYLYATLPASVMAWIEPDPPDDEDG